MANDHVFNGLSEAFSNPVLVACCCFAVRRQGVVAIGPLEMGYLVEYCNVKFAHEIVPVKQWWTWIGL